MTKLHVVDGTYELFRAFYAPGSSRRGPDGAEVGATRRFLQSMVRLLSEDDVTHVGVAFDTVIESFRNDLFDGYKTGAGIDPDLWAQFPLVEEGAAALGMTVWRMVEFEADDALATAAHRWSGQVEQVVICSPDKDAAQCVRGGAVVTRDRMRDKVYDEAGVLEKFGVMPSSIPDWLALVGDDADGIPGIPRWGAKSAAAVLRHYGSIEAIPDDAAAWEVKVRGAKSLADSLAASRKEASLYKRLATLRTDVPLDEELDDLRHRGPRDDLTAFCERLGFAPPAVPRG